MSKQNTHTHTQIYTHRYLYILFEWCVCVCVNFATKRPHLVFSSAQVSSHLPQTKKTFKTKNESRDCFGPSKSTELHTLLVNTPRKSTSSGCFDPKSCSGKRFCYLRHVHQESMKSDVDSCRSKAIAMIHLFCMLQVEV